MKGGSSDPATQAAMAEEVNNRLVKATRDLEAKYASGQKVEETSETGPTGQAYKEAEKKDRAQKKALKAKKAAGADKDPGFLEESNYGDDGDDEDDQEDDYELRNIREQRLRQLKIQQQEKLENIGKGHGQYREVVQDEFLKECTSSERVICHFYHNDFSRCAIMDKHLYKLAQRHIETKFIKINAAKAPFFVDKLKVQTIPSVILFTDGVALDKILGFEGLADKMPEGKEDEWPTIVLARLLASKRMIYNSSVVDDDGAEAALKQQMDKVRMAYLHNLEADDDDFDLES